MKMRVRSAWYAVTSAALLFTAPAMANIEIVDGVILSYSVWSGEATIVAGYGHARDLEIPSSLGLYPVTGIGGFAIIG